MSARELDFFYDFSSPYAYFAAARVEAVAARAGARLGWRPFFLGGLFKQLGLAHAPIEGFSEAKRRYTFDDFARTAKFLGLPYRRPTRWPVSSLTALRLVLAAEPALVPALSHALLHAAWAEDRDLADGAQLVAIADAVGVPGAALLARTQEPAIKAALAAATQAAADRGCPGAPCFAVGEQLFWGQDRLLLVERALTGWQPAIPDGRL